MLGFETNAALNEKPANLNILSAEDTVAKSRPDTHLVTPREFNTIESDGSMPKLPEFMKPSLGHLL